MLFKRFLSMAFVKSSLQINIIYSIILFSLFMLVISLIDKDMNRRCYIQIILDSLNVVKQFSYFFNHLIYLIYLFIYLLLTRILHCIFPAPSISLVRLPASTWRFSIRQSNCRWPVNGYTFVLPIFHEHFRFPHSHLR